MIKINGIKINKILIIHTWGIGDLIMFTPVLKVLRENFPEAIIDVLIIYQPVVAEVLQEGKIINKIIKFPWKENSFFNKLKFISKLRKEKYDWAIVTSWTNPWKGGLLTSLFGIKIRVGTYDKQKVFLYTHQVPRNEDRPQVEGNLDLIRVLGLEVKETPRTFFEFTEKDKKVAQQFLEKIGGQNKILIGFHPGAEKVRRYLFWPKENFIKLGQKIVENYRNARLIIFGGPGEKELCQEIKDKIKENVFLATNFSLKQVAALIDNCQVFVVSDSGLGHLAATTKANVISIFGPSNPKRSAPSGPKVRVMKGECRHPYAENRVHNCLKQITPEMVFSEIKKILRKSATL